MSENIAKHVMILGGTGSGKGHLLKKSLSTASLRKRMAKIIIIDWENEYGQVPEFTRPEPVAAARYLQDLRKSNRLQSAVIRWRFVPRSLKEGEWVVRLAMSIGDCTLVVEEASNFQRATKRSKEETERSGVANFLDWAMTTGRPRGVAVWVVTQRPMLVSPTVRAGCKACICFYTKEMQPSDLAYLTDQYSSEEVEQLKTLDEGKHEFCTWGRTVDRIVTPYFAIKAA